MPVSSLLGRTETKIFLLPPAGGQHGKVDTRGLNGKYVRIKFYQLVMLHILEDVLTSVDAILLLCVLHTHSSCSYLSTSTPMMSSSTNHYQYLFFSPCNHHKCKCCTCCTHQSLQVCHAASEMPHINFYLYLAYAGNYTIVESPGTEGALLS